MIVHDGDFSFRYRVALVYGMGANEPDEDEYAFTSTPREFRTLKGAETYQQTLGRASVLQVGIVRWMSNEEAMSEALRLQAAGGQMQ